MCVSALTVGTVLLVVHEDRLGYRREFEDIFCVVRDLYILSAEGKCEQGFTAYVQRKGPFLLLLIRPERNVGVGGQKSRLSRDGAWACNERPIFPFDPRHD